jgi:hypothetical protein
VRDPRQWFLRFCREHPREAERLKQRPQFIANLKARISEWEREKEAWRKAHRPFLFEMTPEQQAEHLRKENERFARRQKDLVIVVVGRCCP